MRTANKVLEKHFLKIEKTNKQNSLFPDFDWFVDGKIAQSRSCRIVTHKDHDSECVPTTIINVREHRVLEVVFVPNIVLQVCVLCGASITCPHLNIIPNSGIIRIKRRRLSFTLSTQVAAEA